MGEPKGISILNVGTRRSTPWKALAERARTIMGKPEKIATEATYIFVSLVVVNQIMLQA